MEENTNTAPEEVQEPIVDTNTEETPEVDETIQPESEPEVIGEYETENQQPPINPLGAIFGAQSQSAPDYRPLFESYQKIIEAHDSNINFIKTQVDKLGKAYWILFGLVLAALIISIVK